MYWGIESIQSGSGRNMFRIWIRILLYFDSTNEKKKKYFSYFKNGYKL